MWGRRRSCRKSVRPNTYVEYERAEDFPEEPEEPTAKKPKVNLKIMTKGRSWLAKLPPFTNNQLCIDMLRETTEGQPRMAMLGSGMTQTFLKRRQWIQQRPYIHAVLRAYPALGFSPLLELEFKLVAKSDPVELEMKLQPVLNWYLAHDDLLRTIADSYPLCKKSLAALEQAKLTKDPTEYEGLRRSVGLLMLWHDLDVERILKYGEVYRFFDLEDDTENETGEKGGKKRNLPGHPYILILEGDLIDGDGDKRMVVYAEHNEIARGDNFYDGMLLIYLTYSVFLLKCMPSVEKLFKYFDTLLQIQPSGKFVCPGRSSGSSPELELGKSNVD